LEGWGAERKHSRLGDVTAARAAMFMQFNKEVHEAIKEAVGRGGLGEGLGVSGVEGALPQGEAPDRVPVTGGEKAAAATGGGLGAFERGEETSEPERGSSEEEPAQVRPRSDLGPRAAPGVGRPRGGGFGRFGRRGRVDARPGAQLGRPRRPRGRRLLDAVRVRERTVRARVSRAHRGRAPEGRLPHGAARLFHGTRARDRSQPRDVHGGDRVVPPAGAVARGEVRLFGHGAVRPRAGHARVQRSVDDTWWGERDAGCGGGLGEDERHGGAAEPADARAAHLNPDQGRQGGLVTRWKFTSG
jgi:hypothetical protein